MSGAAHDDCGGGNMACQHEDAKAARVARRAVHADGTTANACADLTLGTPCTHRVRVLQCQTVLSTSSRYTQLGRPLDLKLSLTPLSSLIIGELHTKINKSY